MASWCFHPATEGVTPMKTLTVLGCVAALWLTTWDFAWADDRPADAGRTPRTMATADLDGLVGQPVDIAPWAYGWRADRAVQEKPEAYFIPRRLERMDKVYRTAFHEMPQQELKSKYYDMPELLKPLLPKPNGRLQAGLLWTGRLADYQVVLC